MDKPIKEMNLSERFEYINDVLREEMIKQYNLEENPRYNSDYCYECQDYSDDYYIDENGKIVYACFNCPFSPFRRKINEENS